MTNLSMNELELSGISKRIGNRNVITGIKRKFYCGITGLVGSNGAGKSTLLNIISGLLKPDEGEILFNEVICELNKSIWRSKIGYLSQSPSMYDRMSVFSFLDYMLILSEWNDRDMRKKRINKVLNIMNLDPFLGSSIGTLSGGIKQKVAISHVLIHDPPVLLLDEPTNNLDNDERKNLHKVLLDLAPRKIIIIVEHIMDELPEICDSIIVLKEGRLVFDGTPYGLIEENKKFIREIVISRDKYTNLKNSEGLVSFRSQNGSVVLRIDIRRSKMKDGINIIPKFSEAVRAAYYSNEVPE